MVYTLTKSQSCSKLQKHTHTHTHTLEEIDGEVAKLPLTLQRDQALARIIAKSPGAEWRESGNVARRMGNMALFLSLIHI